MAVSWRVGAAGLLVGRDAGCRVVLDHPSISRQHILLLPLDGALMLYRLGQRPPLVGGAPVTQEWADRIGADGYAPNAPEAVKVALELAAAEAHV